MASGTISGKDRSALGSMLELSLGGKSPITLQNGQTRSFIEDGDTVIMHGWAEKDQVRIGFGKVMNQVLPAH
jgi:fumarylacetoacetase